MIVSEYYRLFIITQSSCHVCMYVYVCPWSQRSNLKPFDISPPLTCTRWVRYTVRYIYSEGVLLNYLDAFFGFFLKMYIYYLKKNQNAPRPSEHPHVIVIVDERHNTRHLFVGSSEKYHPICLYIVHRDISTPLASSISIYPRLGSHSCCSAVDSQEHINSAIAI